MQLIIIAAARRLRPPGRPVRWALALVAAPLAAHMVSISTGELIVEGSLARYELRMPLYEVAYIKHPEQALLQQFRVSSRGVAGRLTEKSCRENYDEGSFACRLAFAFAEPVERIEVECTYYAATVPNHVHILRASRGDASDEAVFDLSSHRAEINFVPPTRWEVAYRQSRSGAMRVAGGAAPLLFLAALVLASRSRRELAALAAMLFAGQVLGCILLPVTGWQPPPRFVDAAAALTIAYLAVEILLLPGAGQRWAVVGVLGVFHGLYVGLFLSGSEYSPLYVLTGVALAEAALLAALGVIFARLGRVMAAMRPVQVSAGILLVVGMAWFFVRLKG
ncbi:MAG: HupE/UreJ family protein [Bryobacteraceae bacterium]|nr:HupE/UreJ family protein [Bryobacteraceae bacterium]